MTPAVEAAKRAGIEFRLHEYEGVDVDDGDYAVAVARALGRDPSQLFKTLVASVSDTLRVFVVPADRQLDLRAAGKRAQLADRALAERTTGYVVGGISPLGQRKRLPTTVDESALESGDDPRQRRQARTADRAAAAGPRRADGRRRGRDRGELRQVPGTVPGTRPFAAGYVPHQKLAAITT